MHIHCDHARATNLEPRPTGAALLQPIRRRHPLLGGGRGFVSERPASPIDDRAEERRGMFLDRAAPSRKSDHDVVVGTNGAARRPTSRGGAHRYGALRPREPRAARPVASGLILVLLLVACTKATPLPKDDEPKIRAILDADKTLDRALKEADDASAKGDDAKAADILESKAMTAADDAIKTADSQNCA